MAADVELRVISRAIRDRDLTSLLELNVDDGWWLGDDALQLWRFAKDHYTRYGEVPSPVTVKAALPGYRLLRVDDSMPYLIDTFIGLRRRAEAIEIMQDAGDLMNDQDHEGAIAVLMSGLTKLTNDTGDVGVRDHNFTVKTGALVDELMELRKLDGGMRGVPTGFPTIDRATSGLQPQQLVTIIAPPKVGKSTLALAIARNVHRLVDKSILFVSFEMSSKEQQVRYAGMVGGISNTDLMTGKVTEADEAQLRERLKATEGKAPLIVSDAPSAATISGLTAKIDRLRPDIVFVDGVYLMLDEVSGEANTPQAITNITRSLKRLAQRFNIPIVISTQVLLWKMRKGQVTADAIGYSSSFYQDSDVILALQPDGDNEERRQLKVESSRNCPKTTTYIDWDWKRSSFTEETFTIGERNRQDLDDDDY